MPSVRALPDALQNLMAAFLFQFISQLLEVIPLSAAAESDIALPADIKALQQHLCVVQLSRLLGIYHAMEKKQKLTVVRELMLRYRHGLEFGEKNLENNITVHLQLFMSRSSESFQGDRTAQTLMAPIVPLDNTYSFMMTSLSIAELSVSFGCLFLFSCIY